MILCPRDFASTAQKRTSMPQEHFMLIPDRGMQR